MKKVMSCILNGKAGSGSARDAEELITQVAAECGWETRCLTSSDGSDLHSLAERARVGAGLVVAGGGDGTISAVAGALVGTDVALGVLPMGSLNHFAKDLGIPLELEKAVDTLFTGKPARVDVGEVNGHIFLNNSSIGFYPRIVQAREREQRKGRSKWVAFAYAAALIFKQSRTLHVELDPNEHCVQSYDTPFVFIGNNRYAVAGMEIGTRAILNGGKLWISAPPNTGRFRLVALALETLLGIVGEVDLAAFETTEIKVRMRGSLVHVATDGEVNVMATPLHYRSRPGALRVVVPADN